jgi:hypothetical protein
VIWIIGQLYAVLLFKSRALRFLGRFFGRSVGSLLQIMLLHRVTHPVMGPEHASGMPPPIFYRQSSTNDLGAMAHRVGAKHLVLKAHGGSIK